MHFVFTIVIMMMYIGPHIGSAAENLLSDLTWDRVCRLAPFGFGLWSLNWVNEFLRTTVESGGVPDIVRVSAQLAVILIGVVSMSIFAWANR